jgi:8-oxo-dGTP diphosphatase
LTKPIQVTAAIIQKDGKILIAKRKPESHQGNKWEFPGGKVEDNETPEECLKRELNEEFQIYVTIGKYLGSNVYHYDHISIELMAYQTFWNGGDLKLNDHAAIEWVPITKLDQYDFAPADIPFVDKLRRRFAHEGSTY